MKLPKLLIHDKKNRSYSTMYLLKPFNIEEKETHSFKGEDGKEYTLFIPAEKINNAREAFPTTGIILEGFGEDVEFKYGDKVIVEQNVFRKEARSYRDWDVFWEDEEHGEVYKAYVSDVFVKIEENGELTPRRGVVLCENVYKGTFHNTLGLELPDVAKINRRDIVRVIKSWDEEMYKPGEYLLIKRGGDWRFTHEGKEYIKVDHYFNDIIGVVKSDEWVNLSIDQRHV